jgi:hypothetical protein
VVGPSFSSRSLPLVSKGKLYSTLVLNLLLYGYENWELTASLRQRLNTFHNRCVRAMALPQRTSFFSTYGHPALPAPLAPRSRANVHRPRPHETRTGHLQSEAALGWVRGTHGLVKAPAQVPVTSWPRGSTHLAAEEGRHTLTSTTSRTRSSKSTF